MIELRLLPTLSERLNEYPAVVLFGRRQVGKTTLALKLAEMWPGGARYLDLERPADRLRLQDADAFLRSQGDKLVILDGVHRLPGLLEVLRGVIDERCSVGRRFGHFLLLGSASGKWKQQSSDTLAGRVAYVEMGPTHALEWPADDLDTLWLRGGLPASLTAASDAASLRWRKAFVRSHVQRDMPMLFPRLPADTLGRLWTMLAHEQGGALQQRRLSGPLDISRPTVKTCVGVLENLQLVRQLKQWPANSARRLVTAPQVYVRDSGLLHALLGLGNLSDLKDHPVCGPSFKGFCIDNLIVAAGPQCKPYSYCTYGGSKIDLLIERAGQPWAAIQIERSKTHTLSKGFAFACKVLNVAHRYVVYPGIERLPLGYGAQAIGLVELMQVLSTA